MGSCGEALQDVDECVGRQRWVVVESREVSEVTAAWSKKHG